MTSKTRTKKREQNAYMQLGVEGATLVVKDLFFLRLAVQKSLQFSPLLARGAHLVNQSLDVLLRLQRGTMNLMKWWCGRRKRETSTMRIKKGTK